MCQQIQHMQRLQLAGTLAGGIAHDLNNELMLILGNLDLALDQLPAGYDACDSLEHARAAASRCADMSRQLLSVSRDRQTRMIKTDVAACVTEGRQLLEYIKPPNTRVSLESEVGLFILGNSNQIQQALLELGTNAFEAMPRGGALEIRACRHEDTINISVSDTGSGMTPLQQQRIFEPFYTTRRATGGSGLGLSTVRSIVSGHGGQVGLESRVGQGTIFLLNFPAWKPVELEPAA